MQDTESAGGFAGQESKMIRVIRAHQRHFTDFEWLQTYWLFSFSAYYDPDNIQWGALRVFNDDVVQPQSGFGTHPHEDMEIITVVPEGEITHEDSLGNQAVIQAGDVQRMSAGTGIRHAELNQSHAPVHFYQIWLYPDQRGLAPSYDQRRLPAVHPQNQLLPVASGQGLPDVVTLHTDATIYLADCEAQHTVTFPTDGSRRVFLYITDGDVDVLGQALHAKDQARIDPDAALTLTARSDVRFVLIDVPSCRGWGYDQATLRGVRR